VHPERLDVLGPEGIHSLSTAPLFVYGTLRSVEVLRTLIGRIPSMTAARLTGWRAARLPGHVYPGLIRSDDYCADGSVITGLAPDEWMLLDRFEDDEYELTRIATDGRGLGWAYVWTGPVEPESWSLVDFTATDLPAYVQRCAAWVERRSHGAEDR
jgi:gamma-glutamylcyclotransferase (GGCT)/AIG2-like uncharacterized protein YtfP